MIPSEIFTSGFPKFITATALCGLTVFASGCSPQVMAKSANLDIYHLQDTSASAKNDPTFQSSLKTTCHTLAKTIRKGDRYVRKTVNGELLMAEGLTLATPKKIRRQCKENSPLTSSKGTFSCPVWKQTEELIVNSSVPPIVISQIQANEGEAPCPNTWKSLADTVKEHQGVIIILDSTNEGNTDFNQYLWQTLHSYSNVYFVNSEVETQLKHTISITRQGG